MSIIAMDECELKKVLKKNNYKTIVTLTDEEQKRIFPEESGG